MDGGGFYPSWGGYSGGKLFGIDCRSPNRTAGLGLIDLEYSEYSIPLMVMYPPDDRDWLTISPDIQLYIEGDAKLLFQQIQSGKNDFTGIDLSRQQISCLKQFKHGSNMVQMHEFLKIIRCILTQANFSESMLQQVDFQYSTLTDTIFKSAKLTSVNFQYTQLNRANFRRASINRAKFTGSILDGANFSDSESIDTDFTLTSFKGANLSSGNFSNCNFLLADLTDTNLKNTNLRRANLAGVNLAGANLTSAILDFIDCRGTKLDNAIVSEKYRQVWKIINHGGVGLDLSGVDLSLCDLAGVNLTNANLNGANLTGTNLSRANLSFTNFTNANLSKAVIYDAKLVHTNFTDTNLTLTQPLPR